MALSKFGPRDWLAGFLSTIGGISVPVQAVIPTDASGNVQPIPAAAVTYSAVASVTAVASATDIAILPGSASKTIYVTKVTISGKQTTAGMVEALLIKRSTANSGGTSAAMTAVPHDSSDAAASAAPLSYSANPTTGTAVGTVRRAQLAVGQGTSVVNEQQVFDFGASGKPIVLRSVAEGLAVNLGGVTVTGGVFDVAFEWYEA